MGWKTATPTIIRELVLPYLSRIIYFIFIWQFLFHFTFLNSTVCFCAFILSAVPSLSDNYTSSLVFLTCSCSLISVFVWSFSLSNSNDIFIVCVSSKLFLHLLFKTHILVPSLNVAFDAILCSITSVSVVFYLLILLYNVQYFWQRFLIYVCSISANFKILFYEQSYVNSLTFSNMLSSTIVCSIWYNCCVFTLILF
jgi:hypothetical protein